METFIRLFKAVPIKTNKKKKLTKTILNKTIRNGFILSEEIIGNYTDTEIDNIIRIIEKEIGISPEQFNSSFHKSWRKVRDTDIEQLVVEQIAHYLTTYGMEYLRDIVPEDVASDIAEIVGTALDVKDFKVKQIMDPNYIYIPTEKLKIPKIDIDKIRLVVIRGYTKEEFKEKLLNLLNTGIALKEETIKDVVDVALYVELSNEEIEQTRNKEVKIILYDYLNRIPTNPVEFLRFAIYKSINKTLLIKSKEVFDEIKSKDNINIAGLFSKYKNEFGLERLAEIFYRFKPLVLAFRTNNQLKRIINRIRRLAVKYHKPMPEDYLNMVTGKIKNNEEVNIERLKEELSKVNIFRKIRLAYALKFRTHETDSILYRIRNGKSYATSFDFMNKGNVKKILNVVLKSISEDISTNVKGKKIYIPKNIVYALPTTEKQFTDMFPAGTYITIPKNMIVGVHWFNVDKERIDLDFSCINISGIKVGWDSMYRNGKKTILFSGDMTDAKKPNGASELFFIRKQESNSLILMLNYYNYRIAKSVDVPFKLFVAEEYIKNMEENYIVNPNNILLKANSVITQKQKILGLLVVSPEESRFYFAETSIGTAITSYSSDYIQHSRQYLFDFYSNCITLNEILEETGAKLVNNPDNCDIDLSPEKLTKDTIIDVIKKK